MRNQYGSYKNDVHAFQDDEVHGHTMASHADGVWPHANSAYASQDDETQADDVVPHEAYAHDVALHNDDAHACPASYVGVHRSIHHRINRRADCPASRFLDEEVDEKTHVYGNAVRTYDATEV